MGDDRYTHGHHDAVLDSHRWRTVDNSAAYLRPRLRSTDRLLDVGCGPGTITAELADLLEDGSVVGIDRSEDVLREARNHASTVGVDVSFEVGDVYALDHPDDHFDVVHAHQVLQHLTDPVTALREMRRVTRPGGLIAARDADYPVMAWFPHDRRLDRWLELYCAVAGELNGAFPDAGRRLLAWSLEAGCTGVATTASAWCFADTDERRWWGALWARRMTESAIADQVLAAGLADRAELDDIAAAFTTWSEQDGATFTVVHGEILATA